MYSSDLGFPSHLFYKVGVVCNETGKLSSVYNAHSCTVDNGDKQPRKRSKMCAKKLSDFQLKLNIKAD